MTFDLYIWHADLTWPYLGQVWRSRSLVKVYGHRTKKSFYGAGCRLRYGVTCYLLFSTMVSANSTDIWGLSLNYRRKWTAAAKQDLRKAENNINQDKQNTAKTIDDSKRSLTILRIKHCFALEKSYCQFYYFNSRTSNWEIYIHCKSFFFSLSASCSKNCMNNAFSAALNLLYCSRCCLCWCCRCWLLTLVVVSRKLPHRWPRPFIQLQRSVLSNSRSVLAWPLYVL